MKKKRDHSKNTKKDSADLVGVGSNELSHLPYPTCYLSDIYPYIAFVGSCWSAGLEIKQYKVFFVVFWNAFIFF